MFYMGHKNYLKETRELHNEGEITLHLRNFFRVCGVWVLMPHNVLSGTVYLKAE